MAVLIISILDRCLFGLWKCLDAVSCVKESGLFLDGVCLLDFSPVPTNASIVAFIGLPIIPFVGSGWLLALGLSWFQSWLDSSGAESSATDVWPSIVFKPSLKTRFSSSVSSDSDVANRKLRLFWDSWPGASTSKFCRFFSRANEFTSCSWPLFSGLEVVPLGPLHASDEPSGVFFGESPFWVSLPNEPFDETVESYVIVAVKKII